MTTKVYRLNISLIKELRKKAESVFDKQFVDALSDTQLITGALSRYLIETKNDVENEI